MKRAVQPGLIPVVLLLELIPLLLMPPNLFAASSQAWWLPLILSVFAVISLVQLVVRRSTLVWPWSLLSLTQGLNIISRVMMLMPNATFYTDGVLFTNFLYIVLAVISILLSFFFIIYNEKPEVRIGLLAKQR